MKLLFVGIYPHETVARYVMSCYVLKAYLEKYWSGPEMNVSVMNFGERTEPGYMAEKILDGDFDLVLYSCYIWNIENILEIVRLARERSGKLIHVMGGPEISPKRIKSFSDPAIADFYVLGEGEKKVLSLVTAIADNDGHKDILLPRGVSRWKSGRLDFVPEKSGDNVEELDDIPSIYLNGTIEDRLYERQQVFLETQRGCCFKCKYCVYHKFVPNIKYYSTERVTKELDHLIAEKHVSALRITDSIFTSDLERAKRIVRHLVDLKAREGVELPWIYWEFDYNFIDEEFISLVAALKKKDHIKNTEEMPVADRPQLYSDMLRDYVVINSIGIESFDPSALRGVGRRQVNRERFDEFMNIMKRHNVVLKMDLIAGLPFETVDSFFSGLEYIVPYLKDTDHVLNIHRLQILPGSELEALTEDYKIDYSLEAPHIVFRTNSMTEEELNAVGKLSAILSRSVNSPLRGKFFDSWERSGKSLRDILETIYSGIRAPGELTSIPLVKDEMLYDSYWNGMIYSDVPSGFLLEMLESM